MNEEQAYQRLRFLDDTEKLSYAEVGAICKHVKDTGIWKERCASFNEWIRSAAPWGYGTCFNAVKDFENMSDVPPADLAEIPSSNFGVLRQLSTAVRSDPRVLCAAKTMPKARLEEFLQENHPNQHIETTKVLRVPMDEGAYAKAEEVMNMAMQRGAHSKSDALEMIFAEVELQWRLEAEVQDMVREEV